MAIFEAIAGVAKAAISIKSLLETDPIDEVKDRLTALESQSAETLKGISNVRTDFVKAKIIDVHAALDSVMVSLSAIENMALRVASIDRTQPLDAADEELLKAWENHRGWATEKSIEALASASKLTDFSPMEKVAVASTLVAAMAVRSKVIDVVDDGRTSAAANKVELDGAIQAMNDMIPDLQNLLKDQYTVSVSNYEHVGKDTSSGGHHKYTLSFSSLTDPSWVHSEKFEFLTPDNVFPGDHLQDYHFFWALGQHKMNLYSMSVSDLLKVLVTTNAKYKEEIEYYDTSPINKYDLLIAQLRDIGEDIGWVDYQNLIGRDYEATIREFSTLTSGEHIVLDGDTDDSLTDSTDGPDIIEAGRGDDTVWSFYGNDALYGGDGNDGLVGGFDKKVLRGGSGDDRLSVVQTDSSRMYGGSGNDFISGASTNDKIDGGEGEDTVSYRNSTWDSDNSIHSGVTVSLDLHQLQEVNTNQFDAIVNVENLEGSSYNDTLSGNAGANKLYGLEGNDTLTGGAGDDIISGGDGYDTVVFKGALAEYEITDLQFGDGGHDFGALVSGSEGSDTLTPDVEVLQFSDAQLSLDHSPTEGSTAYLYTTNRDISFSLRGLPIETLELLASGDTNTSGFGNGLANKIYGDAGDNLLDGGGGADMMAGHLGHDRYIVDHAGDQVVESSDAGNDTVVSSVSFTLGDHVETLVLKGRANLEGLGNDLANRIEGNKGHNMLEGRAGDDSLLGKAGNDQLLGGAGTDTLSGGNGHDLVSGGRGGDTLDGGKGQDTLDYAGSNGAVRIDLDKGTARGGEARGDSIANFENVVGGAGDDRLLGDAGSNLLAGGAGADLLNGRKGLDAVEYLGSEAGVVIDLAAGLAAGGHAEGDQLRNIEAVLGSTHADEIAGDGGRNLLHGEAGNDRLRGAGGNDLLEGGQGRDVLLGGAGRDKLLGGNANDRLVGGGDKDRLDGGAGNDRQIGGGGADTFLFSTGSDVLKGGKGRDTAQFDGDMAEYKVDFGTRVVVTHRDSGDRDVLQSIETIVFDDQTYGRDSGQWVELG